MEQFVNLIADAPQERLALICCCCFIAFLATVTSKLWKRTIEDQAYLRRLLNILIMDSLGGPDAQNDANRRDRLDQLQNHENDR